jgi:hypothetical protein
MESTDDAQGQCPKMPQDAPSGADRLNETQSSLNEAASPTDHTTLRDKELMAIDILAHGTTLGAAARMLQIDRKTLYRWRHEPDFVDLLSARRRQLWSDSAERLQGMCAASLDELDEHLRSRYDRDRFRAATALLRLAHLNKAIAKTDQGD